MEDRDARIDALLQASQYGIPVAKLERECSANAAPDVAFGDDVPCSPIATVDDDEREREREQKARGRGQPRAIAWSRRHPSPPAVLPGAPLAPRFVFGPLSGPMHSDAGAGTHTAAADGIAQSNLPSM